MGRSEIINDPNVKLLIECMNLDSGIRLEVCEYSLVGNQIVINKIKVVDSEGRYIKFAKIKNVISHIHDYPIQFKKHGG